MELCPAGRGGGLGAGRTEGCPRGGWALRADPRDRPQQAPALAFWAAIECPRGASGQVLWAPRTSGHAGATSPPLKLRARTAQAQDEPREGMEASPLASENTFLF